MNVIIWQVISGILCILFAVGVRQWLLIHKKNTKLTAYDEQLQDELLKYALSNPNPVFGMDKSGHITFANHGAEIILKNWKTGLFEKIPPEWREIAKQVALSGKSQTLELSTEYEHFLLSIVPRRDGSFSFFGMEITDLKKIERELEDRILYDEHTKLPNRVSFKQSLEKHVKVSISTNTRLGLLIIRLDDYFQVVNTYGEDAAKNVILAFSERLTEYVHRGSNVSRLSENQFAILEPNLGDPSSMALHAKGLIEKCAEPYRIGDRDIYLAISIGIAFCPSDGNTTEILTRNAQLAVNRTSRTKNSYEFFQRGMEEQLQLRRDIVSDLRIALTSNQLELFYQPQIDLQKKQLIGCEALLRWNHPTKGYISPGYFILIAEESNLIELLGEWALREAACQILRWHEQGLSPFRVSVNLSGRQILRTDVVSLVHGVLTEMRIPNGWLALELTESALVQDKDHVQNVMLGLKNLDVELSLDDFGTGYSSLSYLMQFPIDKLKIDRSFVKPIENDHEEYIVTKGIIELAHKMSLNVIAEGVETPAQVRYMHKHNCEIIQGYIFGEPVPAEKFIDYLKVDWRKEVEKYLIDN